MAWEEAEAGTESLHLENSRRQSLRSLRSA